MVGSRGTTLGTVVEDDVSLGEGLRGLYHGIVAIEDALWTVLLGCYREVVGQYGEGVDEPLEVGVEVE